MRLSDLEQRTESIVSRLAADLSRPLWDFNNDRIRAIVESSMQTVELFAVEFVTPKLVYSRFLFEIKSRRLWNTNTSRMKQQGFCTKSN